MPGTAARTVSRISRPFSRIREPVTLPHRQLIRTPIGVPADSGAPFQRRTCRTRRELNLPVHSQTDISVKLIKQSSVAGRRCVTYVNSRPPVRGIVSVQCQVLTPWSVPAGPCPPGPARSYGQVRAGARGGWRAARAGAGKAAGAAGKARGRTVINSAAVSDGMRGNWRGNWRISRRKGVDCLGKGEIASWCTQEIPGEIPR